MTLAEIVEAVGVKPYWYQENEGVIYCADCLKILPKMPDGCVDLVLTDPPYGIKGNHDNRSRGRGKKIGGVKSKSKAMYPANDYPPVYGDDKPFAPSLLIKLFYSKPMFLFGANYYHTKLPESGAWIAWDKTGGGRVMSDLADIELIWTNLDFAPRIFHHLWNGLMKDSERQDKRLHPTQKPVALCAWILSKWGRNNQIVCDPYLGSGTTAVAAKQLGRRYIGIEIEEKYCAIAVDRLRQRKMEI